MKAGILFGLAAGAMWGLTFVVPLFLGDVSADIVALGRFFFYAAFSCAALIPKRYEIQKIITKTHLYWLLVLAILGNSLYYVLMIEAVRFSGVVLTSIIIGGLPISMAVFGARGLSELRKFIPSIILLALGLVIIQYPHFMAAGQNLHIGLLVLLPVAAHASWLIFALGNSYFLKKNPQISPKIWSGLLGLSSFISLAIYVFLKSFFSQNLFLASVLTGRFLFWSAVLGVLASWLANWFWNEASKRLSASLAGQLIVSETVFAIFYECLYHARFPSKFEILAALFLIAGVLFASMQAMKTHQK